MDCITWPEPECVGRSKSQFFPEPAEGTDRQLLPAEHFHRALKEMTCVVRALLEGIIKCLCR